MVDQVLNTLCSTSRLRRKRVQTVHNKTNNWQFHRKGRPTLKEPSLRSSIYRNTVCEINLFLWTTRLKYEYKNTSWSDRLLESRMTSKYNDEEDYNDIKSRGWSQWRERVHTKTSLDCLKNNIKLRDVDTWIRDSLLVPRKCLGQDGQRRSGSGQY